MNERVSRLQAHQRNIERYESLLKSELSAVELRFIEKRLSEERIAVAVLEFMSPDNLSKTIELPDGLQ